MATLHSLKLRGLTSGSATIATVDVTLDSDGYLRFTDAVGSQPRSVKLSGDVARLIRDVFTGVGGWTATIVTEQFDKPELSGAGVNGRADS